MSTPSPLPSPTTEKSRSGPPGSDARLRAVLLVVVTAYLMVGVDSTVVNVALPDMQRDLGFSPTGLSWVLNAYTLAFGGLLLLGGRVGDLLGRRRTLTLGVLLFAVVMFTTVRFVPRLLARFGAKPLILTGMTLLAGAGAWLWRLGPDDGYAAGLVGPLLLLGVGVGLALMPLNATILAKVQPQEAGAASGLLQTLQWLGGTLGLSVLVTVYGTATRHTTGALAEILTHGAARAFGAAALIALTALVTAVFVIRGRPRTAV